MEPNEKNQILARFCQGSGGMAQNNRDYYLINGKIELHTWANGGYSWEIVDSVPESIEGWTKVDQ